MDHAEWEGFRFYDLVFPLFVFMVGVAIPLSLDRTVARIGRPGAVRRVLRRGLILFVLGVLYYGGIAQGLDHVRLLGVLQRIALCYVAVSLLYLYAGRGVLFASALLLLVGYWALLTFVPVPGFGPGDYGRGHNLANWIDQQFLPLKIWYGDYDPEGLLSTLPAIASCIMGVGAMLLLRAERWTTATRAALLAGAGVALVVVGEVWGLQFPVIKRIWTSSYALVAGGWSALLLAAFYWLIDVRGWHRWARPLVWVGSNALVIYLVSRVVDFDQVSAFFVGGEIRAAFDSWWPGLGALVLAMTGIALCLALCRFLYVRKIFLRL